MQGGPAGCVAQTFSKTMAAHRGKDLDLEMEQERVTLTQVYGYLEGGQM